jgi:hypothetical protein
MEQFREIIILPRQETTKSYLKSPFLKTCNNDDTANRNKEAQQSDDTHQMNIESTRLSNSKHQSCICLSPTLATWPRTCSLQELDELEHLVGVRQHLSDALTLLAELGPCDDLGAMLKLKGTRAMSTKPKLSPPK